MSGYGGPDDDALAAIIANENAITEVRNRVYNPTLIYEDCIDCGEEIPEKRRNAIKGCMRCISCQELEDKKPKIKIKMLDKLI